MRLQQHFSTLKMASLGAGSGAGRSSLFGLSAHERHQKLMHDYVQYYGGKLPEPAAVTTKTDFQVLQENHRCLLARDALYELTYFWMFCSVVRTVPDCKSSDTVRVYQVHSRRRGRCREHLGSAVSAQVLYSSVAQKTVYSSQCAWTSFSFGGDLSPKGLQEDLDDRVSESVLNP